MKELTIGFGIGFFIGFLPGAYVGQESAYKNMKAEAIKREFAAYDSRTGEWKWKDNWMARDAKWRNDGK